MLLCSLTASACSGNVLTAASPEAVAAAATNVNVTNPTLTVLQNTPLVSDREKRLIWSDEFDGSSVDPAVWFFESGDGSQYGIPGWGNNEQQWYRPRNARIVNGSLVISVERGEHSDTPYTSARVTTRDRFAFRYGRIEARMRLPNGQGIWPAFWLLPQEEVYGTWAASGEIDIMEAVNLGASGGNTVLGTLHYGGVWPNNLHSGTEYTPPADVTADFHVFAVEWDDREIRWYVDDTQYAVQSSWSTPCASFPAPFDQPFYILLNVAVGGNLPGPPNSATKFPVTMEVDYVRVYSGA